MAGKDDFTGLEESVKAIVVTMSEKEKRQDGVLAFTREVVRDCALAIRHLHTGNVKEAEQVLAALDSKVEKLRKLDKALEKNSGSAYQEYVEAKCLYSVFAGRPFPSMKDLGVGEVAYLGGVADCGGEFRRAMQIALKDGKKQEAERFFNALDKLYDELMLVKFSSSLVGPLKPKQDVLRSQLEHARSEMLR